MGLNLTFGKIVLCFFIILGKFTLEKVVGDTENHGIPWENVVFLTFEDFRKIRGKEKSRKMGNYGIFII